MTSKPKVRLVRGLRLVSTLPGFWKLESDPSVLFQHFGTARLGPTGARYTIERWLTPSGEVATSLDAAVKRYLARTSTSHATKTVTTPVYEDEDDGVFYLTDVHERALGPEFSTRLAAKRAALKLVREGAYPRIEVWHRWRGDRYMQGLASEEGWSDV